MGKQEEKERDREREWLKENGIGERDGERKTEMARNCRRQAIAAAGGGEEEGAMGIKARARQLWALISFIKFRTSRRLA